MIMIMAFGNIKEPLCLGNAEKFQIWRAVLTNVIRGYVCLLSFKFFEANRESMIKLVK
jgi:hypothetical protein